MLWTQNFFATIFKAIIDLLKSIPKSWTTCILLYPISNS